MAVQFYEFGKLPDGRSVTAAKLTNHAGASLTVLDYGATVQALCIPDRDGKPVDVVLGYDTAEEYLKNGDYLGATIGRVGNRIGKAEFSLNGKTYVLDKNDGENHLHGGKEGFDKKFWRMAAQDESLLCWRTSPDGEENYPGNLKVQVLFRLTEDNRFCITYDADTDADTLVNLTNHSYFNLSGGGSVLKHRLQLFAERFAENDGGCLPTGALLKVEGTPFDFRTEKEIGADIGAENEQLKPDPAERKGRLRDRQALCGLLRDPAVSERDELLRLPVSGAPGRRPSAQRDELRLPRALRPGGRLQDGTLFISLAEIPQAALFTLRAAGVADGTAVQNDTVTEIRGALRRKNLPEGCFYFFGLFEIVHEAETVGNADAVRIHHHGTRHPVEIAEQEVRGLAADAGEFHEFFHGVGDLSVVLFQKNDSAADDVPCLGVVKTAGMDVLLDLRDIGFCEGFQRRIARKQGGSHHVDPLVRALCRKPDREEQLIVLSVLQRAECLRVFGQQPPDNFIYLFLCTHKKTSLSMEFEFSAGWKRR